MGNGKTICMSLCKPNSKLELFVSQESKTFLLHIPIRYCMSVVTCSATLPAAIGYSVDHIVLLVLVLRTDCRIVVPLSFSVIASSKLFNPSYTDRYIKISTHD